MIKFKIWFQNRRRRDTMIAQGKRVSIPGQKKKRKCEDEREESIDSHPTASPVSVVDQSIVDSVLLRLKQHQNAPDRLSSKKRVKRPKPDSNDELEEDTCTSTKLEPIVPVEQQSSTNQTPNFYQMQHPVAINDYMTQSYQKYPIQYSPMQNWPNSQNYYYNQMNSYDHSSQQFQLHSNSALQQSSSSFSSSSSFNYSN